MGETVKNTKTPIKKGLKLNDSDILNDILISYYSNKKDITPYYKFLYRNNNGKNERVCSKFLQRLNHPMCLAIWFMDDGSCCGNKSYNSKGEKYFTSYSFYLATNQFNYSDHELMVKWFKQEFDIDCKIYKQIYSNPNHCGYGRIEYRLRFNASNSKKIWQLINPYVIQFDSMKYKFRFAYLRDNLNIKRIPIDFELSDYIK